MSDTDDGCTDTRASHINRLRATDRDIHTVSNGNSYSDIHPVHHADSASACTPRVDPVHRRAPPRRHCAGAHAQFAGTDGKLGVHAHGADRFPERDIDLARLHVGRSLPLEARCRLE